MNHRTGRPDAISERAAEQWYLECEAARAAQTVPFAVSPRLPLHTPRRGLLQPGEEVRQEDFDDVHMADGYMRPRWRVFEDLVREGRILEAYKVKSPSSAKETK